MSKLIVSVLAIVLSSGMLPMKVEKAVDIMKDRKNEQIISLVESVEGVDFF